MVSSIGMSTFHLVRFSKKKTRTLFIVKYDLFLMSTCLIVYAILCIIRPMFADIFAYVYAHHLKSFLDSHIFICKSD